MSQTFKIAKGEILFDNDKIIIKDDARKQKWMSSLLIFLPIVYAIRIFVRSYQTGDQFDYWYGLIIGLLGLLLLIMVLLGSVRNEIPLKEVKLIKLKQRFGNKILFIKLKNNRIRKVSEIDNSNALEQYIKTNFDTK